MRYYKELGEGGNITAVGEGLNGEEISEEEYGRILEAIQARPEPPEGYDVLLREDLTWERVEKAPALEEERL